MVRQREMIFLLDISLIIEYNTEEEGRNGHKAIGYNDVIKCQ